MLVRVVVESRYHSLPDGTVWTPTAFDYQFFCRYLASFSHVEVIARVSPISNVPATWKQVDGEHVTVLPIFPYQGMLGYIKNRRLVRRQLQTVLEQPAALILRIPSPLISSIHRDLLRRNLPYAVEVIGDPWNVFAPGVVSHPLRPLLRRYLTTQQRQQCQHAVAACYVTDAFLQELYPCPTVMFGCSDVDLHDDAFLTTSRTYAATSKPRRLLMLASLEQLYKGPDVLLRALAFCRQRQQPVHATIAGDGRFKPAMEQLARDLGVAEDVDFVGHIPAGAAVRTLIDSCDALVMPSRTEGLPKAMVEAMARAAPCIGSAVGGIPELLDPSALVSVGSAEQLASSFLTKLTDPAWLQAQSQRNLQRARDFHDHVLAQKRHAFFAKICDVTKPITVI